MHLGDKPMNKDQQQESEVVPVQDTSKVQDSGDPGRTPGKAEGTESGNVSGSGSPGRTPGMAEGEDDPDETGEA
jgi:hypothetical protein